MHSRHLIVLAATAALLAGCGGGTEPEAAAAATTVMAATSAATATPAGVRRTAQAVTPEQTAEQLLDFAEQHYWNYFPSHQATQSLAPFRFRHYPQTGTYVGVVVTEGMGYTLNGIYVMGGPFGGSPVYVGQVDHFITPGGPVIVGVPGNGCYDLALMDTPGTHIEVVWMTNSGAVTGTQTLDWVVNGSTMFETHSAIETIVRTTGTLMDDIGTPVDIENRSYARRTADAEVTRYGGETISKTTIGDDALTTTIRTVYTPAAIDRQAGLVLGGSLTQTSTATSTSTTTGLPGVPATPVTTTDTSTETITFVARERLTVQGRGYDTCKFTTTFAGKPGAAHTVWVIDGKGIPVKITETDGDSVTTQEATSVKLNGTRL